MSVTNKMHMITHDSWSPGASYKYLLNCKSLADKGYRVVFYDQIGSGLSQRFPYEYYTKFQADAVNKVFYDELRGVINKFL